MKTRYYYLLLFLSIIGIITSFVGLLGNSVSKKYELDDPTDCISQTSGADLCIRENILLCILIFSIILLLFYTYKTAIKPHRKSFLDKLQ